MTVVFILDLYYLILNFIVMNLLYFEKDNESPHFPLSKAGVIGSTLFWEIEFTSCVRYINLMAPNVGQQRLYLLLERNFAILTSSCSPYLYCVSTVNNFIFYFILFFENYITWELVWNFRFLKSFWISKPVNIFCWWSSEYVFRYC